LSSVCRDAALVLVALALLAGCKREEREFRADPIARNATGAITMVSIAAGPMPPERRDSPVADEYERNAYHLSQGKKLYVWFNCNGCHANGGGDSGPPLMDEKWIYGGAIENIVATIREGRPNGMPSFRGRIPEHQVWQIAAYVRAMGRAVPLDAAPGRNDSLHPRPAENRQPWADPSAGDASPPSTEAPQ
jgi:cytochrome c oxidase cbb3-type subunit III